MRRSQPAPAAALQGIAQGPEHTVHVVFGRVVAHEADSQDLGGEGQVSPCRIHPGLCPASTGSHRAWGVRGAACAHAHIPVSSYLSLSVMVKTCVPTNCACRHSMRRSNSPFGACSQHSACTGQPWGTPLTDAGWASCGAGGAAGGERAAHLAHGGPQAPGDLEAVLVHQKGRDLLPGVALGHPDGGDGGQPRRLVERGTGLNPQPPAASPALASPARSPAGRPGVPLQHPAPPGDAPSRLAPRSPARWAPRTHLLLHEELEPQLSQPLAQEGAVGPVPLPRALQALVAQRSR